MSNIDWLSVALSLFGVASGATVSWVFFRTQLLTDFKNLQEKIASVLNMQLDLAQKIDLVKEIRDGQDLNSIKNTVEKLDGDLHSAVRDILQDVKQQQQELAQKIQNEFRNQSSTATETVKAAFSSEVSKYISNKRDQERLLSSLVNSFMDGMRSMGEYQRINIESETSTSIVDIEGKISASIDDVFKEVKTLRTQIAALPTIEHQS